MIDKIAALRKIAYVGTPNYDSNPPPPGTFYMNPADMHWSTNTPPASVQAPSTNPPPSEVQSDSKRTYPPQITGGKMPPWMKRIIDRLPERRTSFEPPTSTEAPTWMRGKIPTTDRTWKGPYGSVYSDALYRGGHNYMQM